MKNLESTAAKSAAKNAANSATGRDTGICIFDLAKELSADPSPTETPLADLVIVSEWAYAFAPSPLGKADRARTLLGFLRMRRLRAVRFMRPVLPATALYVDPRGAVHEITVHRGR